MTASELHPHDHDIALVETVLERVSELDIEGALAHTTEDLVVELPFRAGGYPRRLVGADARAFMRVLPRLFSAMKFHHVVVHGRLPSGLIVAEYQSDGMTRTGRPYRNSYAGFFGVDGGKVSLWREYFDPNVVDAALS